MREESLDRAIKSIWSALDADSTLSWQSRDVPEGQLLTVKRGIALPKLPSLLEGIRHQITEGDVDDVVNLGTIKTTEAAMTYLSQKRIPRRITNARPIGRIHMEIDAGSEEVTQYVREAIAQTLQGITLETPLRDEGQRRHLEACVSPRVTIGCAMEMLDIKDPAVPNAQIVARNSTIGNPLTDTVLEQLSHLQQLQLRHYFLRLLSECAFYFKRSKT